MSNNVPTKSGIFKYGNYAIDIDTFERVNIPIDKSNYEDISKWLDEIESIDNNVSETLPPKNDFVKPTGVYDSQVIIDRIKKH